MAFKTDLPNIRIILYGILILICVILLGLTGGRIHYTTHLPKGDPLNGGKDFHDPVVVELLVTSIFSIIWSIYISVVILQRHEHRLLSTIGGELLGLGILFLFWLPGAGVATHMWGNLRFCWQYHQCRLLSALVAFTWLAWLVIVSLIVLCFMFGFANSAWGDPLHGRYDPRASTYEDKRDSRASSIHSEFREVRHTIA